MFRRPHLPDSPAHPQGGPALTQEQAAFHTLIPEALEARLQEGIRHALALGADGAEAFVRVSRMRRAKVQNGVLDALSTSKQGGLGLRVLQGGRSGIVTSSDLARNGFKDLFEQAHSLAAFGDSDPWLRQAEFADAEPLPTSFEPAFEALSPEARIQKAFDLESAARRASNKVSAVREASWEDGCEASLLLTQRGVRALDVGSYCSANLELAVDSGNDRQSVCHWGSARTPEDLDLDALGAEAAHKAERKLNPVALPSGRYPIVLHPEVTAELLGLVAEMLSGEAVMKGLSLFADRLGQRIATPQLGLVDDGRLLLPKGRPALGSAQWDGEGVPTQRTLLIAGGELRSFLHTLRSAANMGWAPTGNASRGLSGNPESATTNLYPEPGLWTPDQLFQEAQSGVLITEIMGLHTADPVSGEFSVGASGLRIRDGLLAEAVDRFTLSGNLQDFLMRIVGVGDDLRWFGTTAGLSLLLEEMALGGA